MAQGNNGGNRKPRLSREAQLWLLLICLPLATLGILWLALLGLEPDKRCAMQFPKLLGCLLSRHENLAGGLIAASGALFAGWLAWTAVRDQIAFTEQQTKEVQIAHLKVRRERAQIEMERLESAKQFSESLLRQLQDNLGPTAPYAVRVIELLKRAVYPTSSGQLDTATMGTKLWEAVNRVRMVAHNIENEKSGLSGEFVKTVLIKRDVTAKEAIDALAELVARIPAYTEKQRELMATADDELTRAYQL